jgi:hypothetical protein
VALNGRIIYSELKKTWGESRHSISGYCSVFTEKNWVRVDNTAFRMAKLSTYAEIFKISNEPHKLTP